jgi:26S proteasome regulatory subunit N2
MHICFTSRLFLTQSIHGIAARALDKYFELRQAGDHSPNKDATEDEIDPRLEIIVQRLIARCCNDRQWHQALGICLESRRLSKLEEVARASDDVCGSLRYILKASDTIGSRHVREEVLRLIVRMFDEVGELASEDCVTQCKSLMVLDEPERVAAILSRLVQDGEEKKFLLALQLSFDLFDNDVYVRLPASIRSD